MTTQPYAPDVAKIVADLRDGQVHLDASTADAITPQQLTQLKKTITGADTPIYVIVAPLGHDDLSPIQLVSLVHRELPEDGIYFVSRPVYDGRWDLASTSYGVVTDNANNLAGYVATELYPADLGLQLLKATELVATGTAREAYDDTFPERQTSSSTSPGGDSNDILGMSPPVFGVSLGVAIAVLLAVLGVVRRRFTAGRDLQITGRALERISTAQTQDWRRRAQSETDALGERIKQLQISEGSDPQAWTAALDHYDAAGEVLKRSAEAADSIGALVLARRGEDALDHAVVGKPWSPSVVCFFNPLHGHATATVRWTTPAGSRDVPCCAPCRKTVRRKRTPDFLDLPVGDTVVHYVDAAVEPWASTGYGSLDPDLLSKL
ncbi:hypothetical protein GCM10022234_25650 [Aeromicrobium panaciterrae]|uniref:hypothetical protein n=1 Tax=Aeromicrobium panaciterrae TaxID=363861 RepID=UPI0031DC30B7